MFIIVISIIIFCIFLYIILYNITIKFEFKSILKENNNNLYNEKKYISGNFVKTKIYLFSVIKIHEMKKEFNNNYENDDNNKNFKIIDILIEIIYKVFFKLIGLEKVNKALFTKKEILKINNSIFFKKTNLSFDINLQNKIASAYLLTFFNTIISMYISKNQEKFDLNNTIYKFYIKNNIYNLNASGILTFKFVNNINIFIKVLYRYLKFKLRSKFNFFGKENIKNGTKSKYVTSN